MASRYFHRIAIDALDKRDSGVRVRNALQPLVVHPILIHHASSHVRVFSLNSVHIESQWPSSQRIKETIHGRLRRWLRHRVVPLNAHGFLRQTVFQPEKRMVG